jgi:threonine dehydrogenase-like Zn-dependent dehydrogenase
VLEQTVGRGVDVVVDCAGAENLNQNLQVRCHAKWHIQESQVQMLALKSL